MKLKHFKLTIIFYEVIQTIGRTHASSFNTILNKAQLNIFLKKKTFVHVSGKFLQCELQLQSPDFGVVLLK